jgi:hypothetical protein
VGSDDRPFHTAVGHQPGQMSYVMVPSTGPRVRRHHTLLGLVSLHHHQASIRTRVSPEEGTRCTLVFETCWGCTLPNGLCNGRSRQFQATVRSPQNRVMWEIREDQAAIVARRSPFFRLAPNWLLRLECSER